MNPHRWMVSLHGGHSGAYCEHAQGDLREVLDAAVLAGFHTYGVSEHAPRVDSRYLYSNERKRGWTVETLESNFDAYAKAISCLVDEFEEHLTVLRGFEAEIVPTDAYRDVMLGLRDRHGFDYMVGSAHYVGENMIDGRPETFTAAVNAHDDLEGLCIAYYETVARMVHDLKPEVVGHFDVIRKNGARFGDVATGPIRRAAIDALKAVRENDCILDLNTAGYRKGLGTPYPAPWIVQAAHKLGIGFCFGDDSHGPDQVGEGIGDARDYLLNNGVHAVEVLTRDRGAVVKRTVSLG